MADQFLKFTLTNTLSKRTELLIFDNTFQFETNTVRLEWCSVVGATEKPLFWNGRGNPNAQNYSIALIMDKEVIGVNSFETVRLVGAGSRNWAVASKVFHDTTENKDKIAIYLLRRNPQPTAPNCTSQPSLNNATSNESNILLTGLNLLKNIAKPGIQKLSYSYRTKPPVGSSTIDEYSIPNTSIFIRNWGGISNSPFKPIVSVGRFLKINSGVQSFSVDICNISGMNLACDQWGLTFFWEIYEGNLKDQDGLYVPKDNALIKVESAYKLDLDQQDFGNFSLRQILKVNAFTRRAGITFTTTRLMKPHGRFRFKFEEMTPYSSNGLSYLRIVYTNIPHYNDGEMRVKVLRTSETQFVT